MVCARYVNFKGDDMTFFSLRCESRSGVGIAAKRTGQRCHHRQILAALRVIANSITRGNGQGSVMATVPHMTVRNAVVKSPMQFI